MFWFRSKYDAQGVHYVSSGLRCAAAALDLLVIACVLYIFDWMLMNVLGIRVNMDPYLVERYSMGLELSAQQTEQAVDYFVKRMIVEFLKLVLVVVSMIYCWVKFKSSPGKFLFGMIIVDSHTLSGISIGVAIKRSLAMVVSVGPMFLGFLWAMFDSRCRTWHDMIAGTAVVFKSSVVKKS